METQVLKHMAARVRRARAEQRAVLSALWRQPGAGPGNRRNPVSAFYVFLSFVKKLPDDRHLQCEEINF